MALITNGKPVREIKYFSALAALFGEVSLSEGILNEIVQSYPGCHSFVRILKDIREFEGEPEVERDLSYPVLRIE